MTGSSYSSYPTAAGRGWIPGNRDLGLPGEGPRADARQRYGAREGYGFCAGSCSGLSDGGACSDESCALAACRDDEGDLETATTARMWDADRKVRFLHYLAEKGDVRAAAARVGVSRQSAYVLRRRDAAFATAWRAALVLAREAAEAVLASRALDGVEEAVWFRGEAVGVRRRFDSRLLLAHLGRLDRMAEAEVGSDGSGEALAARFDELLARVAGEVPEAGLMDGIAENDRDVGVPDPLLPLSRADWSRQMAGVLEGAEVDDWLARRAAGEADAAEEPVADPAVWRARAARIWDRWGVQAVTRVDAILAGGDRFEQEEAIEVKSLGGLAEAGMAGEGLPCERLVGEALVAGDLWPLLPFWTVSPVSTSAEGPVRSGCSRVREHPGEASDPQPVAEQRGAGGEGAGESSFITMRCPALPEARPTSSSAWATWAAATSAPSASSASSTRWSSASTAGSEGIGPVIETVAGAGGAVSGMIGSLSKDGRALVSDLLFQICKPPWRNSS